MQTPTRRSGFFEDARGNRSSTRLITFITAITALVIAVASIIFERLSTTETLPLVIALLSFAAGEKGFNAFIENRPQAWGPGGHRPVE